MLDIYVGDSARKEIEQNGFESTLFSTFLGASGGPKWFSLFGLDKYLFGEFFKNRSTPLDLIGSSAGAFRAACFTQKDPVKAITSLATRYSETDFSSDPSPQGLTRQAEDLLEHLFTDEGIEQIVNNPIFKAHFIVAKSNGFVGFENKFLQGLGLLKSYTLNRLSRKLLRNQYQRYVFGSGHSDLTFDDHCGFDSHYIPLTKQNVKPALLASGAIPLVMAGIKDIPDAPKGMYRDGGIIDYHFDISPKTSGLTLYPHFNADPKAGWFDKSLPRRVQKQHYDNSVMLVPSDAFIAKLPYGKIPDRTDFDKIAMAPRLKYWRTVFSETEQLAEQFDHFITSQDMRLLKPMPMY